ncbi:MAG: M48 family metallopeptidase [Candidatus Cloacimonetes bacterium]|nr:M48 family metallopeptidase [Candidatus Cloacimonadota bacterium]MBS3767947.1 M48 family metallopeptidase [Candidatus Cloacimonadota bacterium]
MNIYLIIILAAILVEYVIDLVANHLNLKNLKTTLPGEFEDVFDEVKYAKSQHYTRETTKFSNIQSTFMVIVKILFILLGGFNLIDMIARGAGVGNILTGLIFFAILLLLQEVVSIPFSAYSTFVIEEKFGFNKTSAKTFVMDIIKSLLLSIILGSIILAVILLFFQKLGDFAWVYAWLIVVLFSFLIQYLAPKLILPLFNKFTPLQDDELKQKIRNYVRQQGFKLKGIFTIDGSRRTTKMNAYFTGFGKYKRVAFYDTLQEKLSNNEILAVLGHEIGHYKLKHILKSIVISIFTTGITFFLLSLFIKNPQLFAAFRMEHLSIYASIVFFGFLLAPLQILLTPFSNYLSRKHEYAADEFAVETIDEPVAMKTALKKLSVNNLSNLTPHRFYVFLNYSHPPVLKRIKNIEKTLGK